MMMRTVTYFILFAISIISCSKKDSGYQDSGLLGVEDGNGGDVLYCKVSEGKYITQLLDFVEAEIRWPNLTIDLGGDDLTVGEKVVLAIKRLKKLDMARYEMYLNIANSFETESLYLKKTGFKIKDVQDNGYIPVIPDNCEFRQIAIQKQPQFPEDKRYLIDESLWNLLIDDNHKAGLMLHEIIYRDALLRGQTNSAAVRYLTALLSSSNSEQLKQQEYHELIEKNDLRHFRFEKYHFILNLVAAEEASQMCRYLGLGYGEPQIGNSGSLGSRLRNRKFHHSDLYSFISKYTFWVYSHSGEDSYVSMSYPYRVHNTANREEKHHVLCGEEN